MDDWPLIGNGKTVIEMISDQVPKLIGDQFDWPSNVHGKTGTKCLQTIFAFLSKKAVIFHTNLCKQWDCYH